MHVVATLAGATPLEFWTGDEGHAVLTRSLAVLRGFAQGRLLACADSPALREALERAGFSEVHRTQGGQMPAASPLAGLEQARALAEQHALAGPLLLRLDNPLLAPEMLEQGRQLLVEADGAAVLSVTQCHDHPCQMFMAYKMLDMGLIHFFDPGQSPAGRNVTLGFHFPWAEQAFTGDPEGTAFAPRVRGLGVCLEPVAGLSGDEEAVYLREGPSEARLALRPRPPQEDMPGFRMVGRSYRDGGSPPLASLWLQPGTQALSLRMLPQPGWSGRLFLRLTPVRAGKALPPHQDFDLDLTGTEGSVALPLPASLWPDIPRPDALLYSVLAVSQNASCDFSEYFEAVDGLWTHEASTKCVRNCATGQEITGRQGFPLVVSPDGSLAFVSLEEGRPSDLTGALGGNALGLTLCGPAALRIRTPLDVLRWRMHMAESTPGQAEVCG